MNLIFETLGTPSKEDMAFVTNDNAMHYITSLPPRPKKNFYELFPKASPLGQFLSCLSADLRDRLRAGHYILASVVNNQCTSFGSLIVCVCVSMM